MEFRGHGIGGGGGVMHFGICENMEVVMYGYFLGLFTVAQLKDS